MEKPQSGYSLHNTNTLTHYKTYTHTHTLQNNIKPPQYNFKQTVQDIHKLNMYHP